MNHLQIPDLTRAVVFDLDGTLWNACSTCAAAWNSVLRELGYNLEITGAEIESVCGLPFPECVRRLCPGLQEADLPSVMARIDMSEQVFLQRYGGALYPGVIEGLHRLAQVVPIYLVSNCQESYLRMFFSLTGTEELFRDWECHGRTSLPKTKNLKLLAERNGFAGAVYVGDTEGDRLASLAAGYSFVYASYGFGDFEHTPSFSDFPGLVSGLLETLHAPRL